MTREETIMRLAKGFRGRAKNCYKIALRRVEKGLQHAYRGRKLKKRVARTEWISQVGAGAREHGLSYSKLVQGMNLSSIGVNRKIMAQLAQQEPYSFRAIVEEAKSSLKSLVLRTPQDERALSASPTMLAHADASSTTDRGVIAPYEGPPLPPYPRRIKQYS
jgi:large subunit ribosomal protein L20